MATYVEGQSKTSFVRTILNEIGAVTEHPPEGWKKKVEEALAAQNIKMNQVTIYQTRLKMLKGKSTSKNGSSQAQSKKPMGRPAKADKPLSVEELVQIRDFCRQLGGVVRLNEGIKFLQSFSN